MVGQADLPSVPVATRRIDPHLFDAAAPPHSIVCTYRAGPEADLAAGTTWTGFLVWLAARAVAPQPLDVHVVEPAPAPVHQYPTDSIDNCCFLLSRLPNGISGGKKRPTAPSLLSAGFRPASDWPSRSTPDRQAWTDTMVLVVKSAAVACPSASHRVAA